MSTDWIEDRRKWLTDDDGLARRLKELQGKTPNTVLAEHMGVYPSRITKIRKGDQPPSEDDIRGWVAATGNSDDVAQELIAKLEDLPSIQTDFERRFKFGQAAVQRGYNKLIEDAAVIKMFERTFIPRLLQTHDYAKAVLTSMGALHGGQDDVDAAVAVRLECQRFLYDGKRDIQLILDEVVLDRWIAPVEVMREQLLHLERATSMRGVRLGILPRQGHFAHIPQDSFELYGDIGYVEGYYGELELAGDKWAKYDAAMELLWPDAVEGDAARAVIARALADLPED